MRVFRIIELSGDVGWINRTLELSFLNPTSPFEKNNDDSIYTMSEVRVLGPPELEMVDALLKKIIRKRINPYQGFLPKKNRKRFE